MSMLEDNFEWLMKKQGIPAPVREMVLIPGRKFAFDFTWPEAKLCLEIDGGTGASGYKRGRHSRPKGQRIDCEKARLAAAQGWMVIRATTQCCTRRRIVDTVNEVGEVVRLRTIEQKKMRAAGIA